MLNAYSAPSGSLPYLMVQWIKCLVFQVSLVY